MQPPKKITIISDFAYPIVGGTEKYVYEAGEQFSKKNKVTIISPIWSTEKKEENFLFKRINKNFKIIRFGGKYRRNAIIKPLKFLIELIKNRNDCDVVNGHYFSNALVTILFAKIFKKKSAITLYEVENLQRSNFMIKLLNSADKIITISDTLKDYLEQKGLKNIEVIPPWITIGNTKYNQNELKKKYKLTGKQVVLFVGRIIKTKGVEELVKAIPLIKKKIKNIKVVCIGAKIDNEIIELPEKLGVNDNCDFLGFVSEKEKDDYNKLCDIAIYPPYVKGGFGFVLLEAMKYNKAVIGSDNWGVPDAVGNAGIIIPQKDHKAIASAVIKILTNKSLRNKYEKLAGIQAKKFEKNTLLTKYEKILTE
ncbi:MAG TPA: glycosyltransferase family 4 protein [Candidatus Nanoarchaeia archaeon]|nr:glycosyltransferase family 4 protein [Candidatus Nanoarchaeia archaeon]